MLQLCHLYGSMVYVNTLMLQEVTIAPKLSITRSGGNVSISWLGSGGTLESATELKPTNTVWTSIGTQNPATISIETGQIRYYRVKQ